MGGFGAINGMIQSIKENSRLITERKTYKDHKSSYKNAKRTKPLIFKDNMTQKEHDRFRQKLKNSSRLSTILMLTICVTIILLTVLVVNYITSIPGH